MLRGSRLWARETAITLPLDREIDEHDAVLLDDADQQNDADQRDQAEIKAERHQCHERAETRRRQGRQDRQRMNVALIEHAQDDADDDDRRRDEIKLAGQRRLECLRVALGNCRSKSPARRARALTQT
jgi:hypothetical protein